MLYPPLSIMFVGIRALKRQINVSIKLIKLGVGIFFLIAPFPDLCLLVPFYELQPKIITSREVC